MFFQENKEEMVMSKGASESKTWGELMCIKERYISIRGLFVVFTLLPTTVYSEGIRPFNTSEN